MTTSNLQKLVGAKLINDMLRCESVRQKEKNDWKVLVMDRLATRIISASCKMHDIMSEGITIVEDIMKRREPLGMLEAVYFIQPNDKSINELINDFDKSHALVPKYKAAHVFFTEACNAELFSRLTQSKCAKYIKTLREVNIAFLPYERQAFTLDSPDTFYIAYNPTPLPQRTAHLDVIAEQIATLCATLGEYPIIRYRADNEKMAEFAQAVQQKLNQYKADDATMGEGVDKAKSVLLLLDRGFDAVSPLLHELTFQAMAHDLLKIENDVFEYEVQTSSADPKINPAQKQKVLLDENDELWTELRITEENLSKLLSHAFIPTEKKNIITNMQYLNLQIIQDQSRGGRRKNIPQARKERTEQTYTNSRWTPYVKDIMEDVIDDKLDSRLFPSIGGQRNPATSYAVQSSREYGGWMQTRRGAVRAGPRLIIFILGGVAYNELRCAYEVTQSNLKKWEVLIGSDQIITPRQFLRNLEMKLRQEDEQ
ncbi:unnamed protein product [Rotaria sp. Silwood2]|nr:unnamed protein product [Rotaria sp. Silwood2]